MTFASRTVTAHVSRGVLGLAAVWAAVHFAAAGWPPLVLLPLALVALRGCPLCWTIGLVQTVLGRRGACTDGSCATTKG